MMEQSARRLLQPIHRARENHKVRLSVVAAALLGAVALVIGVLEVSTESTLSTNLRLPRSQLQELSSSYLLCSASTRASLNVAQTHASSSIYTGDELLFNATQGFVDCVAVNDGHIVDVGREEDIRARRCLLDQSTKRSSRPQKVLRRSPKSYKAARLERARARGDQAVTPPTSSCDIRYLRPGQTLFPGFQDAHGHVLDYGWSRSVVDLVGADSIAEVVRRLEAHVAAHPELFQPASSASKKVVWLEGLGWDQTRWNPPAFPSAADLSTSAVLRHLPIALRRIDVHALWLSEEALSLVLKGASNFPSHSRDDHKIHGGLIMRDMHGQPTGILIDKAMDLAYEVIPKWSDSQRQTFLDSAAEGLLQAGITAVGDAATDLQAAAFYKKLDEEGRLPFRIYSMLACPTTKPRCADMFEQIRSNKTGNRFTLRAVKLFNDGALGSWGSSMWNDYADKAGETGLLLIDEQELKPLVSYWLTREWQVCTHAIGDRANTLTLDAYEAFLLSHKDVTDRRPRIEHAQLLRPTDIRRFRALGVIASMQPTHCTSDMGYVETRIGSERAANGAYAWSSLLQQNASLALGSDFPVELPDPLLGIYSAITRLDANATSPHGSSGWYPHERLTRRQALQGFTRDVSFAQFEEHVSGTISVGKRADFTLLDRNILDEGRVSPLSLRNARIDATFIDGKVVYDGVAAAFMESRRSLQLAALTRNPVLGLRHVILHIVDFGHAAEFSFLAGFVVAIVLSAFLSGVRLGAGEAYEQLSTLALNVRKPTTAWLNMGHWTSQLHLPDGELDLPTACDNLARELFERAKISTGRNILDVGCGSGDSSILLQRLAQPSVLHAVTSLGSQARYTASRLEALPDLSGDVRVWAEPINEWLQRTEGKASSVQYDVVLALDCAYHFRSRTDFIRLASRRLKPGGVLAFVDLLHSWPPPHDVETIGDAVPWPTQAPSIISWCQHRLNCLLLSAPIGNFWSVDRYTDELVHAGGFEHDAIDITDITGHVFPGFARYLEHFGKGGESWRGGTAAMRFSLGQFADIVARWGRGGNRGLVRCCIVIAKKSLEH